MRPDPRRVLRLNINCRLILAVSLFALAAAGAAGGMLASTPVARSGIVHSSLQCGHWCVLRCCELFGVQMDLALIQELLPYDLRGHSLAQLGDALGAVGLEAQGRLETAIGTLREQVPCVAHLQDPDHFVVVVAVDDERVHVYDGAGQRTTRTLREFGQRWSGYLLTVRRTTPTEVAPPPGEPRPDIRFSALMVDKGVVAARGEHVRFEFPFQNIGSADLSILSVECSCSCLLVEKPSKLVPPSAKAQLSIVYQPPTRGGPFQHEILVRTNVPGRRWVRLKAAGFADTGIEVVPSRIDLGAVVAGKPHLSYCFVHDPREWQSASLTNVTSSIPGLTTTHYSNQDPEFVRRCVPEGIESFTADPRVRVIQLTWTPDFELSSRVEGELHIHTTAKGFERITVPIVAKVGAPLQARPSFLLFDAPASGEPAGTRAKRIVLTSVADQPFRIVSITPDRGNIESGFPKTFVDKAQVDCALPAAPKDVPPSVVRIRAVLAHTGEELSLDLPVFVSSP